MNTAIDGRSMHATVIHSQPTDTLLKITMHRSDNFFAEQALLMVSNEKLGIMNNGKIIDTLLKTDYAGMPQAPKWVDGSGLSRYNLITPQDFVWLLNKMKQDFGWQRITGILQTGGQGTLSSYYKKYAGRIYAKTGTLSNNVSLSGYLITNKGRTLSFSVMVNNHKATVSNIRREVEAFLGEIMEKY
jgi:D-alanyl-D-alanine carboxypeptidase/D-alanyl-D-alanine-endopeptidase (penicillin-binding protein 4)